jgi:hypothetical protein
MAQKKIYWHRVTESFADDVNVGTLLGLMGKETEVARFVDENGSINLKMYAKVEFLGTLPVDTPAKVVADMFGLAGGA